MTLGELFEWLKVEQDEHRLFLTGFDHAEIPGLSPFSDGSNAVVFAVNEVAFCVREDPDDGYRSHMEDDIGMLPAVLVRNRFEKVAVTVQRLSQRIDPVTGGSDGECDVLQLLDASTGAVVVEVGTDSTDDYYPRFIGSFYPEAMAVNVGAAAFSVPKRQPHDPDAPARGINLKGWQHGDGDGGEK